MSAKDEQIVAEFLDKWNEGMEVMKQAYRDHFASDAIWEQSGIPTTNGVDEAVGFLESTEKSAGLTKVSVKTLHIASVGNVVFTERHDAIWAGENKLAESQAVGVFEINADGKISAWRDYFDPSHGQSAGAF